jgi:hypothetical protein
MSNETFKTDHGNVPKLTEENNPVWKQQIRRVIISKKAYNILESPVSNSYLLATASPSAFFKKAGMAEPIQH